MSTEYTATEVYRLFHISGKVLRAARRQGVVVPRLAPNSRGMPDRRHYYTRADVNTLLRFAMNRERANWKNFFGLAIAPQLQQERQAERSRRCSFCDRVAHYIHADKRGRCRTHRETA
jgi:hypothetical protein